MYNVITTKVSLLTNANHQLVCGDDTLQYRERKLQRFNIIVCERRSKQKTRN